MPDASTAVAVLPFYQLAEPYILTAFGVLFSAILTWGVSQLQTRTNIHVSDNARLVLQQAATNAAGRILAAQEGNLANVSINVHSPLVAAEVPKMTAAAADAINHLGVTPDQIRDLITAKVGLVSASTAPAISAAPTSPSTPAQ